MLDLYFTNAWRWACGLTELDNVQMPTLEEIQRSEWSCDFEKLMRNRLVMGAFRYGFINNVSSNHAHTIANCNSIEKRLNAFRLYGNAELLVDIANICMVEYMQKNHKLFNYAAIDDGEHIDKIIT